MKGTEVTKLYITKIIESKDYENLNVKLSNWVYNKFTYDKGLIEKR